MNKSHKIHNHEWYIRRIFQRIFLLLSVFIGLTFIGYSVWQISSSESSAMMTGMKNVDDISQMNFQNLTGFKSQQDFIRVKDSDGKIMMSKGTEAFLSNRKFQVGKLVLSGGRLYDYDAVVAKGVTYEIWLSLTDLLLDAGMLFLGMAAILLMSYLLGLLLIRNYSRKISAPIKQLAIESGQEHQLLTVPEGPVEVRDLAISFNQLLQNLQAKIAAEQDFATNLSHELRTPVMSISGYISLLKRRRELHPEVVAPALDYLEKESARLQKLIEDFLTLSRQGQMEYKRETFVLADLLDELAASLSQTEGSEIRLDGDCQLQVTTNRFALQEILTILLENAQRYAPAENPVTVKFDASEIQVIDLGPGIPDAEKSKIFERFYQVDKSRNGRENGGKPGNGIGLAIAQQYAQNSGLELTVSDNSPHGNIFHVRFGN